MADSLLLVLLTTTPPNPVAITCQSHPDLHISEEAEENIAEVVRTIDPPTPDLIKTIAQKELYEILSSIINKGYGDAPMSAADQTLNSAIGMVLEKAILEASQREAAGADVSKDRVIALRNKLREEIIDALTPK